MGCIQLDDVAVWGGDGVGHSILALPLAGGGWGGETLVQRAHAGHLFSLTGYHPPTPYRATKGHAPSYAFLRLCFGYPEEAGT